VLRDCQVNDLGADPSFARRAQSIAARTSGVELNEFCVRPASDFADIFRRIRETGNRGLLVSASPLMDLHHKQIVDLAAANRIPAMYDWTWWVRVGALVSYGASLDDMRRGQANYVDKILKGAAPGDLPILQPTRFEVAINMKTVRALRLAIPPLFLVQTDLVFDP
jgi:putative ABC transport system substrate-binding protein